MWSTSALFGRREYSQSRIVPHSGQLVSPLLKSSSRRWSLTLSHLAVPVRDDVGLAIDHHFLRSAVVWICVEGLALLCELRGDCACVVGAEG